MRDRRLDHLPCDLKVYLEGLMKPKKPLGRPPIPGRRVIVKLEEKHIQRAKDLGGKIAAGIRKALS